jgi:hypothetical protein
MAGAHPSGVMAQLVNGAPVREGVNPRRAVLAHHNHCFTGPVFDAFERVGQDFASYSRTLRKHDIALEKRALSCLFF